jgi:hypothetical protein
MGECGPDKSILVNTCDLCVTAFLSSDWYRKERKEPQEPQGEDKWDGYKIFLKEYISIPDC